MIVTDEQVRKRPEFAVTRVIDFRPAFYEHPLAVNASQEGRYLTDEEIDKIVEEISNGTAD